MPNLSLSMKVDLTADAAYIRFTSGVVVRSVEVSDEVLVDLDEFNMAVGVEVLDLGAEIPFRALVTDFHVPQDAVELLRRIRPTVNNVITSSSGSDGSHSGAAISVLA